MAFEHLLRRAVPGQLGGIQSPLHPSRRAPRHMTAEPRHTIDKPRRVAAQSDEEYTRVMQRHRQFDTENPRIPAELRDALARRMAAMDKLIFFFFKQKTAYEITR